ncbi:MAG: hypothetical protein HKN26_10575 [Acidimicrobiales bacterium]|nr:hypothetical protein [Acidimicrobiales bacterium]
MMIASVHLVDTGVVKNLTRRVSKPADVPGLLWSGKMLCGQLGPGALPDVDLGRGGMVAWWKDDAALDAWWADDPRAQVYRTGWQTRLRLRRGRASWPNADFEVAPSTEPSATDLHAAVTLGKTRVLRAPRFLKASAGLEEQFVDDPGSVWGVAITMPPRTVMTLTFWQSMEATDRYIGSGAHGNAMQKHYDFPSDTHEFVTDGGFFGFEPYAMEGKLGGKNPTPHGFAELVAP